jgi:hypothetical protein
VYGIPMGEPSNRPAPKFANRCEPPMKPMYPEELPSTGAPAMF